MRFKDTKYTVEHETTRNVFFQGSFDKCKAWLLNRPDWEQYVIIDPYTDKPMYFALGRNIHEARPTKT
ncbi:MAG: hypothetical protein V3S69_02940 [Dehalococcoidales bacterium]